MRIENSIEIYFRTRDLSDSWEDTGLKKRQFLCFNKKTGSGRNIDNI